jgi:hypothetical protein
VILGQPGDPNRHVPRPVPEIVEDDEYVDFRTYSQKFLDLQLRIQQIRERSAMYPIWAGDVPSIPNSISRKFSELNQQLFALKKCFVSPEEIMLDNTATVIQRFWRAVFQRQLYKKALLSIQNYKMRELSGAHRSLNSWMAQMEYADSRAQQLNSKSVARVSKLSLRYWQKWSEKECVVTNRNEAKAHEQLNRSGDRRHRRAIQIWREIALGPRSSKALKEWRQSMIPVMKRELENQGVAVPMSYIDLVSSYVSIRAHRSFLFNFFLAWHAKVHSKSLRQTLIERQAFVFHKKKLTTTTFKKWITRIRNTKAYLVTPERWAQYIALGRAQHQAKRGRTAAIVAAWHVYSHHQSVLRNRRQFNRRRMMSRSFGGWRATVARHRALKLEGILVWKRHIQDPKVVALRSWRLWALKKRTRRMVGLDLDRSHNAWRNRFIVDCSFGLWQRKLAEREKYRADIDLERRHWKLQATKQDTQLLSALYTRDRDRIAAIETELGDVTAQFVGSEEEVSRLEELSTTWKIALHALKMELMRLGLVVQRCSTPDPPRRRRFSSEDSHDRLSQDDRYAEHTQSRLSHMQTSDRVIGKWVRRNSDPDLSHDIGLVDLKPPLDENVVQLIAVEK